MSDVATSRRAAEPSGEEVAWAFESGRFQALGHEFSVRTTCAALGRHLDQVFSPFTVPGAPATWYSIRELEDEGATWYLVDFGDDRVVRTRWARRAFGMLLWHVNQETIRRSHRFTLLHASAAERDGIAAIFPAPMESGKTTLVAGLLRAGLRYLTDEAAAIDPENLTVHPFPKALSIDPGSWGVLADLEPHVDPAVATYAIGQWQVVPDAIRPAAVAPPTPVRFVVAPRYSPGAATRLEPVGRAGMLRLCIDSTFRFTEHGRRNFAVLAELARRSECFRLTVGDLRTACDLVLELFDRVQEPQHAN